MQPINRARWFRAGSVMVLSAGLLAGLHAVTAQAQGTRTQGTQTQGIQAATPWTVAIYMNADHNLDPSALADLEEMESAGGGTLKNVRVVYYLDRNDDEEGAGPGVEEGVIENGKRRVVQRLPEQNSDDPKVLSSFVSWAYKTYPSQKRGLILWDHGGQWDGGFGGDEHGPGIVKGQEHRPMSGAQTAAAVAAGMKNVGVGKFDFLSFDSCLMSGAELLAQFAPLTSLYIADAEVDYGDGWDYEATLTSLDQNPGLSMTEFGKLEVAQWEKQHLASGTEDDVLKRTQAAFDTARWPAVQDAINAFALDLRAVVADPARNKALFTARADAISYSEPQKDEPRGTKTNYIDLGDFAARVGRATPDAALKTSAADLQAAIANMTVAKSLGTQVKAASGLSVYLPVSKVNLPEPATLVDYAQLNLNSSKAWSGFEAQWLTAVKGTKTPIGVTGITVAARAPGNGVPGNGAPAYHVEFTPSGPSLDAALVTLYSLGSGGSVTDYGDVYYEKTAARKQGFDWTSGVWSMSDGAGGSSLLTADRDNPGDTLYSVDASYAPPGEEAFGVTLRFNPAGQVVGALDNSGISPIGIDLKPGGTVQMYVRTYKAGDTRPDDQLLPQKLRVPASGVKGFRVGKVALPAGKYQLAFSIFDVVGNDEGEAVDLPGR